MESQTAGTYPGVSDLVGLSWDLRICTFAKFTQVTLTRLVGAPLQ